MIFGEIIFLKEWYFKKDIFTVSRKDGRKE